MAAGALQNQSMPGSLLARSRLGRSGLASEGRTHDGARRNRCYRLMDPDMIARMTACHAKVIDMHAQARSTDCIQPLA